MLYFYTFKENSKKFCNGTRIFFLVCKSSHICAPDVRPGDAQPPCEGNATLKTKRKQKSSSAGKKKRFLCFLEKERRGLFPLDVFPRAFRKFLKPFLLEERFFRFAFCVCVLRLRFAFCVLRLPTICNSPFLTLFDDFQGIVRKN